MSSVNTILENFGVKLKKDTQKSLKDKLKEKAAKYGNTANENSTLENSIKFEIKENKSNIEFTLSMADYWQFVDKGRKPGPVSRAGVQSIKNWIKAKNLNPAKIIQEITKSKTKVPFEQAVDRFAFIVARKLKRKGYKENKFYTSVIKDGRLDKLKKDLAEATKKEIIISFKDGNNV